MRIARALALGFAALGVASATWLDMACSSSTSTSRPTGSDASIPTIPIGVSDSLSGGLAGLGIGLQDAIRVAEQQINASGGVLDQQVRFIIEDDESDSKDTLKRKVDGLLAQNIAGLIGPLSSGQVLAVDQAVFAKQVVQISPSATSPLLTLEQPKRDRFFFRTAPPDDFQGKAVAKFITQGVKPLTGGADAGVLGGGCHSAAIVNGDDGYGNALSTVVTQSFTATSGNKIVLSEKVATKLQADYKATVGKILTVKPECLVLIVYSDVGAQFMRDLKSGIAGDTSGHDWSKFFVSGSDGEYDDAFIPAGQKDPADPKSANSAEGVYGTTVDTAPDTTQYAEFANLFKAQIGKAPGPYTANIYDAAMLIALAIQQAGTATEGVKIRDALYAVSASSGQAFSPARFSEAINAIRSGNAIKYTGASGPCTFDDFGNVTGDYIVWHVEKKSDGTFGFVTVGKIKATEL
jgi:branched-chain amino acid transport system substrate-binding protein